MSTQGKAGGITPQLCEGLSVLTCDEWSAVSYAMDRMFEEKIDSRTEPVRREASQEPLGISGSALYERLAGLF